MPLNIEGDWSLTVSRTADAGVEGLTERVRSLETIVTSLQERLRRLEATTHGTREGQGHGQVGRQYKRAPDVRPEQEFDTVSGTDTESHFSIGDEGIGE